MTREEINDAIMLGDRNDYIEMLENFMDTLEDTIWMLKNNDQYDDNEIYDKLENMRCYCDCINSDSRATGTLMKQMNI